MSPSVLDTEEGALITMPARYNINLLSADSADEVLPHLATIVYDVQRVLGIKMDQFSVGLLPSLNSFLDLVLSQQPWSPLIAISLHGTINWKYNSEISQLQGMLSYSVVVLPPWPPLTILKVKQDCIPLKPPWPMVCPEDGSSLSDFINGIPCEGVAQLTVAYRSYHGHHLCG